MTLREELLCKSWSYCASRWDSSRTTWWRRSVGNSPSSLHWYAYRKFWLNSTIRKVDPYLKWLHHLPIDRHWRISFWLERDLARATASASRMWNQTQLSNASIRVRHKSSRVSSQQYRKTISLCTRWDVIFVAIRCLWRRSLTSKIVLHSVFRMRIRTIASRKS